MPEVGKGKGRASGIFEHRPDIGTVKAGNDKWFPFDSSPQRLPSSPNEAISQWQAPPKSWGGAKNNLCT